MSHSATMLSLDQSSFANVIHRQDCEALVSGSTSPVTVTGVRADVLLAEGTVTQAADLRKSKSHSLNGTRDFARDH